jgi:RNA polymerase sigma-70 factor, ECF subfamily
VRGILVQLPQDQRKALEMAFFEGMTHTEIAGKTGEPLGTVKTRIRTGLLALRKVLA